MTALSAADMLGIGRYARWLREAIHAGQTTSLVARLLKCMNASSVTSLSQVFLSVRDRSIYGNNAENSGELNTGKAFPSTVVPSLTLASPEPGLCGD